MLVSQALQLFVEERRLSASSPRTISFYTDSLKPLLALDATAELDQLQALVNRYFSDLADRNLAPASNHTYWRAVKTFTRWCAAEELAEPIKLPKIPKPQTTIRPMSSNQVLEVLSSFSRDYYGHRNRAIVHTLWDTGLRVSELCRLGVQDVNWDERWLFVTGKGKKERWVPFGNTTKKLLWTWWKQRARYTRAGQHSFFVSKQGRGLDRRVVQMVFRHLKDRFEFPGVRLSAHTLRHTFAVSWIEAGGDPFSLQKILGHSTQEMTSKYVNLGRSNLTDQHERCGPGDRH
jgi:integrase/recombinase XerC/integrase/recombinase XerD